MSIILHNDRVELSLPVTAALIAFASKDTTRPHLGIGFQDGRLNATDGHTLLSFDDTCARTDEASMDRRMLRRVIDGKVWSRAHVETALKVARAQKAPVVRLMYADALPDQKLPPVTQAIPTYGVEPSEPIKFNPDYFARMSLAAKACGEEGAVLINAKGELDPVGFLVGDRGKLGLSARVVVMPMRRD